MRAEAESVAESGETAGSRLSFSRLRLDAAIEPLPWMRAMVRLQDSRTLTGPREITEPMYGNHLDARHAYVELGSGEEGAWNVRVGRQPLAFGGEMLVGADAEWCNRSLAYDGVRATANRGGWRWDLFSAAPVAVDAARRDGLNREERLSGLYTTWSSASGATIEPYLFWKRYRPGAPEESPVARYDLWTPGFRVSAPLWLGFEIVSETAFQRGKSGSAGVSAWASFWEVSHALGIEPESPSVALSYARASGHRGGARVGTFHDLNPAGYNGAGFLEPFGWRNIRDLRVAGEWTLRRQWKLGAEYHFYWLDTVNDGVYVDGGPFVMIDAAAPSSRLGSRALVMAQRSIGSRNDVAFGYAKFFASEYMKRGSFLEHSAFVAWTLRF